MPIKYPEGYKPLQVSHDNPGGYIETRQLHGGGVVQYELDKDDRVLRVTGRLHDDDVVYKRSPPDTATLDAKDREWYRERDVDMLAAKAMHPDEYVLGISSTCRSAEPPPIGSSTPHTTSRPPLVAGTPTRPTCSTRSGS